MASAASLLSVYKAGVASTLDIVNTIRARLPQLLTTLPPELTIKPLFDQSIFVTRVGEGRGHEAVIAAVLTAVMILLFLGDWRHTIVIAISIPLSILASICALSVLGETINIMTLGGLALAVGILVDDATVTIENIDRIAGDGQGTSTRAILEGARRSRCPHWCLRCASASCSCRCSSWRAWRDFFSCRWRRRWSSP